MNAEKLTELIQSAFENPRTTFHRGAIVVPLKTLDLKALLENACETEDEQDLLFDEGPGAFCEKIGWSSETVFAFYWQSLGPMVWECYLKTLDLGDGIALLWRQQDAWPGNEAIALIKRSSDPAVMSALFKVLINKNGADFGVSLFGSLPSNTDNRCGVPGEVVRAAYWEWLKWADDYIDWLAWAEEISARARSPITYPLELLKKFGGGFDGDVPKWLSKRRERNGRLSARAKRAIFEAYFHQSYGPY